MLTEYMPDEDLNFKSQHKVCLKFLWGTATAEVITTIGGNLCGGEVIKVFGELEDGFSAPSDNEINQKHCLFDPDDTEHNHREVVGIVVFHPTKGEFDLDLETAQKSLVSVEIISYKEDSE